MLPKALGYCKALIRWTRAASAHLADEAAQTFSRTSTACRIATCPMCPYRFAIRASSPGSSRDRRHDRQRDAALEHARDACVAQIVKPDLDAGLLLH